MYTVVVLQEKLDKAKGHLREVEDHLLKVDGKPANTMLRYVRPEFRQVPNWGGTRKQDHDNDENVHIGNVLGRKVLKTVHEDTQRRIFGVSSRRRQVSLTSQEPGQPRKRMFPSVTYDEETSPARKKAFQSVVAKVELPDLNVSLKRGRERRDREKDDETPGRIFNQPRNVFSRLSGPTDEELNEPEEEEQEDDEEIIMKRQPVISSIVEAIERPTPSREEVIASQTQDEVRMKRDKRMFGSLVGTLQQFRRDETKVKQRDERRLQIEKKLEEDAKKDKERMFEEKRQLQVERKRRESDIKRIEWSLNRVKEFDTWQTSMLPLKNFIQTKSEPKIFYLPKTHILKTEKLLEESIVAVQHMIDKRLSNLNEEIETSERKAKRLVGEEGDINKENEEVAEESNNDAIDIAIYNEDQIDGEMNVNVKVDSMNKEIKIERHDNGKRNDDDVEKNVTDRAKGEHKIVPIAEEVMKVPIDLDSTLKPQLPVKPTEVVGKTNSPVHSAALDISDNDSSKERQKSSVKKSTSPLASSINKAQNDFKAKESTTDHTKTDSGKPKVRPRSRSRSRGDRKTNRPRRSRSLSKRRRSRSRSRSKGRRRSPKRSPIRRRRSLSKRRQSPMRRLSDDKSRPNRRVEPSKRPGRRSSRSRSKSNLSSSSSSSN